MVLYVFNDSLTVLLMLLRRTLLTPCKRVDSFILSAAHETSISLCRIAASPSTSTNSGSAFTPYPFSVASYTASSIASALRLLKSTCLIALLYACVTVSPFSMYSNTNFVNLSVTASYALPYRFIMALSVLVNSSFFILQCRQPR